FVLMCFYDLTGLVPGAENESEEAIRSFIAADRAYPSALAREHLADEYRRQKDSANVIDALKASLELRDETFEEGFPAAVPLSYLHLAEAYKSLGKDSEALESYRKLESVWRN